MEACGIARKMIKYFVTSDIHGFFDEFINALDKTDFSAANPDHVLIICGDIFDRGTQPLEVYDFLREIPKERRILIRGNHELLLKELVKRGYPLEHDIHNGTYDTLAYIAKQPDQQEFQHDQIKLLSKFNHCDDACTAMEAKREARKKKLFNNRKLKEILRWIDSEFVNYYETDNFIFVHSFIPTQLEEISKKEEYFGYAVAEDKYYPDWRNASEADWERAVWGCPYKKVNLNQTGKTIVCGHWHTSDFWNHLVFHEFKYDTYKDDPIFYQPGIPLIGLDACTAATGGVNILTIEGDKVECFNHNKG